MCGRMAVPSTAVSYTHLDVYKRQGYGGREELENAGADYLAADLHELKQLLLQE